MRCKEIRFAVGEIGDQLSPIWKAWSRGNDVYLAGKFTGGTLKISLHASGKWIVATSSESNIKLNGNRRMKTWERPLPFRDGWTWGPHILVPRLESVDDVYIDEKPKKHIEWIPKPPIGKKAVIALIFASSELSTKDISQISGQGDAYLEEYLELSNLEKVFLRIRYEDLTPIDHNTIGYLNKEANEWAKLTKDVIGGWLAVFMQDAEVPFVYIHKFGSSLVN